jgi:hypothetical protein
MVAGPGAQTNKRRARSPALVDEIALESHRLPSRKIVTGERKYRRCISNALPVPMHSHESEQMTHVLQGVEVPRRRDGGDAARREVLHIPRASSTVPRRSGYVRADVQPHPPGLARHTDDYLGDSEPE